MRQFKLTILARCFFLFAAIAIPGFFLPGCSSTDDIPSLEDLDKPITAGELEILLAQDEKGNLPEKPVEAIKPIETAKPLPENIRRTRDDSVTFAYRQVVRKISNHEYVEALDMLHGLTTKLSAHQPYGVEIRLLRLILLAGLRAGYLKLADSYQSGWDTIQEYDRLESKVRIDRLAKLSRQTLVYNRLHKETLIRLIKAFDDMMEVYHQKSASDLKLIYPPFKEWAVFSNPYLDRIRRGQWYESGKRNEAEIRVINNAVQAYFLSLLGTDKVPDANLILKDQLVILNESGFLFWLDKSLNFHTKTFHRPAFCDNPGLIRVIKTKSNELQPIIEKLLREEKAKIDPKGKPLKVSDRFNPDKLLSQYSLK